jgi:AAA+ ATPase superfamily predicted ATPase
MKSFAQLFKKYRLRAEFETISSFSNALSEKGFFFEESIFYHWQKGTRVPNNRQLILKIIELFGERDAIKTIEEANAFLSATGLGYLTEKESNSLSLQHAMQVPFQVPSEIAHFTGRERVIAHVKKELKKNNVFLFYGPPGVGKTALAIKLGHALRSAFPDGVLWYKVDSSNLMDILYSIARLFGEDISEIKDVQVRASAVRTLLSNKKVLLIFDNVTKDHKLHLLLPNNPSCSVIFSSREIALDTNVQFIPISVQAFTEEESLDLFTRVFDKKYVAKEKTYILAVAKKLGFLLLALDLIASHSRQS